MCVWIDLKTKKNLFELFTRSGENESSCLSLLSYCSVHTYKNQKKSFRTVPQDRERTKVAVLVYCLTYEILLFIVFIYICMYISFSSLSLRPCASVRTRD
jgi:hypothetical protein